MKNYYFPLILISLFFGMFTVNAQNVNIPDANFKAALLNHNPIIDTNGDGEIQVSESQGVDTLYVNNKGITDMTGIGSFVNVKMLQCSNNFIVTPFRSIFSQISYRD